VTSLALASISAIAGKSLVVLMIYACLLYGLVAQAVAKRHDREEAEEDAELEQICQEGQYLRTIREQRRCLGGRRVA
jgi:hypothetical protein